MLGMHTQHVHRGHRREENTVYQSTDLLHRADDSHDNHSQPEQQAENGFMYKNTANVS